MRHALRIPLSLATLTALTTSGKLAGLTPEAFAGYLLSEWAAQQVTSATGPQSLPPPPPRDSVLPSPAFTNFIRASLAARGWSAANLHAINAHFTPALVSGVLGGVRPLPAWGIAALLKALALPPEAEKEYLRLALSDRSQRVRCAVVDFLG